MSTFRTDKVLSSLSPSMALTTLSLRHFMELVCAGLSKNSYMSSAKKVSTITWFKEYFERDENREILVHAGFWEDKQAQVSS